LKKDKPKGLSGFNWGVSEMLSYFVGGDFDK